MIASIGILMAIFLLGMSAFFSAAETGLVSLSAQKAKRLAIRNPNLSQALSGWIGKPHELLTLVLIGNTLALVMFAAVVTGLALFMFKGVPESHVELLAWLVETAIIVVFGDMAPKIAARSNPEKASLFVLPWLSRLRKLLGPFFWLYSGFMNFFLPRWKTPPVGQLLTFSLQELRSLLEESQVPSGLTEESVDMMQRVLDINDRRVESIMIKIENVDMVEFRPSHKEPPDREKLIDILVENGHTRTPIKEQGRIIGFIHSSDLMPLIQKDAGVDLMGIVRMGMEVPSDQTVSELLQVFRQSGVHAGFVVNRRGKIIGWVTLEDVLEEITGEILDEYDVVKPEREIR